MSRLRHLLLGSGVGAAMAVLGAVIGLAPESAGASAGSPQPIPIQSAAVTQAGQALVWRVQLGHAFAPAALAREQRALCLLIERSRAGSALGRVCVTGPARHSSRPRLVFMKIAGDTSGRVHAIAATITRTSSSELTASFLPGAIGLAYRPFYWQVISSRRTTACSPPAAGGSCSEVYPAAPSLLKLHTPVLIGCVASGPSLVYRGPSRGREVALTFDDGPWSDPPTLEFVRLLEREHVPATFFEIGRQIAGYDPGGRLARRMLADGDMIGDHSWSHPMVATLPAGEQRAQLVDTIDAIRRATRGFTPCLWRPPYGDISPSLVKLARSLGLLTIMWNVDPRDWSLPGVNMIESNVVTNTAPGSIVLQHVGGGPRFETLAALPREIATLRRRGYRFVTVDQLLGLRLVYR